jgi:hypothetical protein
MFANQTQVVIFLRRNLQGQLSKGDAMGDAKKPQGGGSSSAGGGQQGGSQHSGGQQGGGQQGGGQQGGSQKK